MAGRSRAGSSRGRLVVLVALALGLGACVDDFDLGVGAFEVGEREAILWTHVVPVRPEAGFAGLTLWLATDADFRQLERWQFVTARADHDFTARVRVRGLQPATRYWYRFTGHRRPLRGVESPIGSFRTAPTPNDAAPVRFVISGDSNIGYTRPRGLDFHVLSAAAQEDADFFVYFGDTIYADSGVLPGGGNAVTLDEYREVHRLTRADTHLQALLAATGTYSGWDDHEVRNDYAGQSVDPARFAAGARAFFEYLPLRSRPEGPDFRTHRRVRWGRHLELFLIDGRQFRSAAAFCNETSPDGPEAPDTLFSPFEEDEAIAQAILGPVFPMVEPLLVPSDPDCVADLLGDPERTLLGAEQRAWLEQALLDSTATFKVIVNDVPLSTLLFLPYDRWEGYVAERAELLAFIAENLDPAHTLVLTTDFHTNLAIFREELTEVIVGPIGQQTFGQSVRTLLPPDLAALGPLALILIDALISEANGGGAVIGSAHDAFSYARVDVFEDAAGEPRLRVTIRGNPDYLAGANDAADVQDLFSVELP